MVVYMFGMGINYLLSSGLCSIGDDFRAPDSLSKGVPGGWQKGITSSV